MNRIGLGLLLAAGLAVTSRPGTAQEMIYAPDRVSAPSIEIYPRDSSASVTGPGIQIPLRADTTNVTSERVVDQLINFNRLGVTSPLGAPVLPGGGGSSVAVSPDGTVTLPAIDSGIGPVDSPLVTLTVNGTVLGAGGPVTPTPLPDVRLIDQITPRNLLGTAAAAQLGASETTAGGPIGTAGVLGAAASSGPPPAGVSSPAGISFGTGVNAGVTLPGAAASVSAQGTAVVK